ncbi:hypothetical protein C8P63_1028 [Melghirimyces profundicolus]|uniref:Uncharacterized protein n=1 Tax=Melghirimyces profundicolus TaxID=1242148 RepID=A0A2T6C881_9BACL|nr:hypothetical protein [Melghirimyces profundicolus]PTX64515.1 hypothetical protein C8P63_1028 [Melghirimyces profundicolus]
MGSQTESRNHHEEENDFLDMVKGTMIFTGLFMGIALIGAILAELLK